MSSFMTNPNPHDGMGVGGLVSSTGYRASYLRADERLREVVYEALSEEGIDATEIEVVVNDGEVTLRGTVPQPSLVRVIEVAAAISGIGPVRNELKVR
jgi:osmotically-inducible protein OsmY